MMVTRLTTEGLLRLDVRVLVRAGALVPGASSTVTWDAGALVATTVATDKPDCLMLTYAMVDRRKVSQAVTECIPLLTTPGTVGGVRAWFGCPNCGLRCAVLYALHGRFRCRQCHHLAYASTRA
jgi:predicted RNA-binding Zn-ribbon protein involved in translation (DUF1610 family)